MHVMLHDSIAKGLHVYRIVICSAEVNIMAVI